MVRMVAVVFVVAGMGEIGAAQSSAPLQGTRASLRDPFITKGMHWCATGLENDARVAAAEAEAAARRSAAGAPLPSGAANIDERYGFVVFEVSCSSIRSRRRPEKRLRFVAGQRRRVRLLPDLLH